MEPVPTRTAGDSVELTYFYRLANDCGDPTYGGMLQGRVGKYGDGVKRGVLDLIVS